MYTNVTNYENDPNYTKVTKTISRRFQGRLIIETVAVYEPVSSKSKAVAIPQRNNTTSTPLDLSKIAEAQTQANKISEDLS